MEDCPPLTESEGIHVTNPTTGTILTTNVPFNYTWSGLGGNYTNNNTSGFYTLNGSYIELEPCPMPTNLRENPDYILYYITVSNIMFMGICPMIIMIIFNILVSIFLFWHNIDLETAQYYTVVNKTTNHYLPKVVRAVNEANRKRARMTMRQQRNLTITGLLVAVVIVFLVCHSLKLILNCYEVGAVCN